MRVVPALDRGLQILELLNRRAAPVKIADIINELAIPRSATYELLHTLRERDYVDQDAEGRFTLGRRLFALGSTYSQSLDLTAEAQQVATDLMRACDETVQVGVLDGRHVLYIARADTTRMVRLVSAVGRRIPAHCTGIGKTIMAQLPLDDLRARLADADLEQLTPHSITDRTLLEVELDRIRVAGVGYDDRESNPEVRCVAAPVQDAMGTCVAAISISVPLPRMDASRGVQLADAVIGSARELSSRLGHSRQWPTPDTSDAERKFAP